METKIHKVGYANELSKARKFYNNNKTVRS